MRFAMFHGDIVCRNKRDLEELNHEIKVIEKYFRWYKAIRKGRIKFREADWRIIRRNM